jgi:D-lyxose ketol-isomerase
MAKGKAGLMAGTVALAAASCCTNAPKVETPRNADYYDAGGKFQADKAKEAYFAMMTRFGYPIPANLRQNMWVTDFGLGDFARVGMAGIFWYNDKATGVFGHEIYLLPGQMIVEHGHEAAGDVKAKREAWHVRHGSIHTLGEGQPAGPCPVALPESQAKHITVKNWKLVREGELDDLKRATAKHFMIAGPQGAIVTEYGTFHDNAGLRFTNPKVKF